ncbi:hypothetical protein MNBD_GAMMA08-12 [hydrothermal vent metagenome]|uniref:DUF4177 domain-containing protein n=1 Tax=hydrothermal vent metagenome TaxID=652676 RepID=A0A3B0WU25_9ZZZZ
MKCDTEILNNAPEKIEFQYEVISSSNIENFNERLNQMTVLGWELISNLNVTKISHGVCYSQMLIKRR